jgi:hypothetical protein
MRNESLEAASAVPRVAHNRNTSRLCGSEAAINFREREDWTSVQLRRSVSSSAEITGQYLNQGLEAAGKKLLAWRNRPR